MCRTFEEGLLLPSICSKSKKSETGSCFLVERKLGAVGLPHLSLRSSTRGPFEL